MDRSYKIIKKLYVALKKHYITFYLVLGFALTGWLWSVIVPNPLFNDPFSSVLVSREGNLLGAKIAQDEQWRFPPVEKLPEKYTKALVCFEDNRFYWHPGFDPIAMCRAFYLNHKHKKIITGGSTLTMQVIRLARRNQPRTYKEKILEVIYAIGLELTTSKYDILKLYASHAPFGGNVVGIEAASWRYFGRPPELLSWAESSLLSVLPKNPANFHPGKNRDELKERRDNVLRKLYLSGAITKMDMELALFEPIPDKPHDLPRLAPHLLETILSEGKTENAGRINTTISYAEQKSTLSIVKRYFNKLRSKNIYNIAAIVVDNNTMEIKAYIGNSVHSNQKDSGYAVDLVHRPRSTGSILKPLLYAAMLQSGEILPRTLVPDLPTQYGNFAPQNYDHKYRGAVPACDALAQSLNVPAVRMLSHYGVHRFYDVLKNLGMKTLFREPQDYGLSLILGGSEATLWDLTSIYANLANIAKGNGDEKGAYLRTVKTLVSDMDEKRRISDIAPGSAWLTMKALLEVTRPGEEGYWKNFSSSQKIAWKTGTSYGHRDAWAIGSDASYTVGVWVGNADGEGRPEIVGVAAAAPILFEIFDHLGNEKWFETPYKYLEEIEVSKNDGYLPFGGCETEMQLVPKGSNFDRVTPHNRIIHLDKTGKWRVTADKESIHDMQHVSWFVLPPAQEYYYRKYHSDYKIIPSFRKDCDAQLSQNDDSNPIQFIYPNADSRIYIPVELDSKKGRTVFEVAHRNTKAVLFWHLDDEYLGSTEYFHQQALNIEPGLHAITIVDNEGNSITRRFEVLEKS